MLKNFITYEELMNYYPNLASIVKEDDIRVQLNTATMQVANDLRSLKGFDVSRLYIPLMFGTAYGENNTVTDFTSDAIAVNNEKRFAVEVFNSLGATLSLSGSLDNTHFIPIKDLTGDELLIQVGAGESGSFSKAFFEGYKWMKYSIAGTATFYAYLVATDADQLIIQKVLQLVTLPLIGTDGVATQLYNASVQIYGSLLNNLLIDYDLDRSGMIDPNEEQVMPRMRMSR